MTRYKLESAICNEFVTSEDIERVVHDLLTIRMREPLPTFIVSCLVIILKEQNWNITQEDLTTGVLKISGLIAEYAAQTELNSEMPQMDMTNVKVH